MLKTRIIPCLDVKDGRVVKGVNFVDLVDAGDPVEQARFYDASGADELCFLDITASHEKRDTLFDVVARTAEMCFMPLTVGGGVRSAADVRKLLLAGADKIAINTAAVTNPELIAELAEKFGSQCITVAVDAKAVGPDRWEIFIHGGRTPPALMPFSSPNRRQVWGPGNCWSPLWTAMAPAPVSICRLPAALPMRFLFRLSRQAAWAVSIIWWTGS